MKKKDSVLEKALLQAKMLEEAVKTNAKGILASTMKQEIDQLVKESLEDEMEEDTEDDSDETSTDDSSENPFAGGDTDDENDLSASDESNDDEDVEDSGEESGIEIPTDGGELGDDDSLEDDDSESDDLGFGDNDDLALDEPVDLTSASDDDIIKIFRKMGEDDGIIVKQGEDGTAELNIDGNEFLIKMNEEEEMEESEEDEEEVTEEEECEVKEEDEIEESEEEPIYEIEFDDESDLNFGDESGLGGGLDDLGSEEGFPSDDLGGLDDTEDYIDLDNIGNELNTESGFSDTSDLDLGSEGGEYADQMGTDEWSQPDTELSEEDEEIKETARTLGKGNRPGALRKGPKTANKFNQQEQHVLKLTSEVKVLREKNEEYKKALGLFREKINEVAVFNANLAYATRLFTEHSTTKQEKLQILKKFDNVSTLKESKNLYKTIKTDLDGKTSTVNESVVDKITKTPSKGSTEVLTESAAYESDQVKRMKELFAKMKK